MYKPFSGGRWVATDEQSNRNHPHYGRNLYSSSSGEPYSRPKEEIFRLIIENHNDLVVEYDTKYNIIFAGPVYCSTFGKTENQLLGKSFLTLVNEEDRSRVTSSLASVFKPPYSTRHKDRAHTVNGTRWFEWSAMAVLSEQKEVESIISVGRDITEQESSKQRVEQQKELLSAVDKAQELFISGHSPSDAYREMLHILVKTTGSAYGFLDEARRDSDGTKYKVSLAMSDISWNEESKRLYEELKTHQLEFRNLNNLSGAPYLEERIIIANDVEHHPLSGGIPPGHPELKRFMGIPLFYAGEVIGVAGIANAPGGYSMEIAERIKPLTTGCAAMIWADRMRRREQETINALKESEKEYRRIAETANEGILSINDQQLITYVNQYMADMLGYSPEEMIGLQYESFMDPEEIEDHLKRMATRRGGEKEIYERKLRHKSGREVWTIISATALQNDDGSFAGSFAMLIDITDRKRAEEETRSLLEEKEILLKDTHHRVKNNMNIIASLLSLSANTLGGPASAALREAESRVRSMALLYEKVYRSKITGKLSLQSYLPPLINDSINMFTAPTPSLDDSKLEDTSLDVKTLTTVGIILNELATNTMKYAFCADDSTGAYSSHEQSSGPPTITIAASKNNGLLTLVYADNGCGIPVDLAREIFGREIVSGDSTGRPESLEDESTRTRDTESSTIKGDTQPGLDQETGTRAGSGFGLQLVQMLTDQLEGSLSVQIGNGTRFHFEFAVD